MSVSILQKVEVKLWVCCQWCVWHSDNSVTLTRPRHTRSNYFLHVLKQWTVYNNKVSASIVLSFVFFERIQSWHRFADGRFVNTKIYKQKIQTRSFMEFLRYFSLQHSTIFVYNTPLFLYTSVRYFCMQQSAIFV